MLTDLHINAIGIAAGICTTISFLPQIVKIIRTGHARDLSLMMYIVLTAGVTLWLIYGVILGKFPIILANGFTLSLCLLIIFYKLMYDKKDGK